MRCTMSSATCPQLAVESEWTHPGSSFHSRVPPLVYGATQTIIKAATVLPPPIRDKAHRLFAFVDTRFWRRSFQSGTTMIAVEIISEREKLRLQVGRGPE